MGSPTRPLVFEAFGVRLRLDLDAITWPSVTPILPPARRPCEDRDLVARFGLRSADGINYEVTRDGDAMSLPHELDVAIGILDASMRMEIAQHATDWTFIHAGAVAVGDRALVLPGLSFSGKTTLVEALIRQGATYYSDEYALLDDAGRLHPYPKPLSIRSLGATRATPGPTTETLAADIGAEVGDRPLRIELIASMTYRPGASWKPRVLSPAGGALALLSHAVTARDAPDRVLPTVRNAAQSARALEGERGEADAAAGFMLELLTTP